MGIDASAWPARAEVPKAPPARADAAAASGTLARVTKALLASRGRVKPAAVVALVRHLAVLLAAGLQLSKALRTMARQDAGTPLGAVVARLAEEVESGEMLSSAMARRRDVFDPLTINIVRAGEAGGTLPHTLGQLADDLEQKQALRRTVVGALAYPSIVLVIAACVIVTVLVYVVPVFRDIYTKMNLDLPWITMVLLGTSRVVVGWWWALGLGAGGGVAGLRWLRRREGFRRRWDALMLRLPVVGPLRRDATAARFFGAFATLVGSGVSVVESLRLMIHIANNAELADAVRHIHDRVSHGGRLAEPMERHSVLFPPMATQMIAVGEQTGSLPEAAGRAAEFLAQGVHVRIQTLTTLLEPLLTVALGLIVGAIALAIYLPIFDLMKHVSH